MLNDAFGAVGSKIVLGDRADLVPVLRDEPAGRRQPAGVLLRPRRHDHGQLAAPASSRQTRHVPPYALLVAAVVPAVIVIGSKFSTDAITKIISFARRSASTSAFQMVVLAALRARLKGWVPSGKYQLGRWGMPVNVAALVYGVVAMINMAWPRTPGRPVVRQLDRARCLRRWSSASAWCTWRSTRSTTAAPPRTATPSRRRSDNEIVECETSAKFRVLSQWVHTRWHC